MGDELEYYDRLLSYAISLTKNKMDADDLVQETYLKYYSYNKLNNWKTKALLFLIIKNSYIDKYRMAKRHNSVDIDDNMVFYNASSDHTVLVDDIYKAFHVLSDTECDCIKMRISGYKYTDIQENLHLPIGTVKAAIFNAREKLEKIL